MCPATAPCQPIRQNYTCSPDRTLPTKMSYLHVSRDRTLPTNLPELHVSCDSTMPTNLPELHVSPRQNFANQDAITTLICPPTEFCQPICHNYMCPPTEFCQPICHDYMCPPTEPYQPICQNYTCTHDRTLSTNFLSEYSEG
ncbi:hypothetical protein ElyMa_001839900 [Elysia marginata]|uniref:FZ domain-containing protein n=1 Tax=Elysia marginata TaxID=1093978 RepID=A0AAV4EKI8_9GAST|nr:hypothetical protein ElyMa_001839900 [Elysia marginata]